MSTSLSAIGPVMLVGAGKMGLALARGWLDAGLPGSNLVLVDPNPGELARALSEDYELPISAEPVGLKPNVLVLAVKPQIISGVMESVRPAIGSHTLVVSIAAGISLETLETGLGTDRIVRTMPNTPAQIGKGITGAIATAGVDRQTRDIADRLLRAAGDVVWLDSEGQIDALTAVSGCGPAYVFHLVETLARAGEKEGLAPDIAMRLARQTVIGAAGLLETEPTSAAVLRETVTSPNGVTAAALEVLMDETTGLPPLIEKTIGAARRRSEDLGA